MTVIGIIAPEYLVAFEHLGKPKLSKALSNVKVFLNTVKLLVINFLV